MKDDFDRALFQATYSNFINEIFEKQMQAVKVEMDLIRKIEGKTKNTSSHIQIIKICRKSIDYSDNMLKDIKEYFYDLKIHDLYILFQTLFRIMVYNIKKMSECYLNRFQRQNNNQQKNKSLQIKGQKDSQNKQNQNKQCLCDKLNKRGNNYRKLQLLDFQIANLQTKEAQLQNKMHLLISNLSQQKQKIEKINSTAHFQKIFLDISHKSENYFHNFFKANAKQQTQLNYMCLQQLQNQVFNPLKNNIKDIAKIKIQKIIELMTNNFKNKLQKNLSELQKQFMKKKKKKCSTKKLLKSQKSVKKIEAKSKKYISFNNDSDQQVSLEKIKTQNKQDRKHIQQRQVLLKQIDQLKCKLKFNICQIQELKQNLKKQQLEKAKVINEKFSIQNLFKKRTVQLEQLRTQMQYKIRKTLRQSSLLAVHNNEPQQNLSNRLLNKKKTLIVKTQVLDKQIQTDQQPLEHSLQNNFSNSDSVFFQHKSFMTARTKIIKGSTGEEEKTKQKKKLQQTQKNLKSTIEVLCQFLFKSEYQKNNQQKEKISQLCKQQKYNEIVQKIKVKLDDLYNIEQKKILQQVEKNILQKNRENRSKKNKNQSKKSKISKQHSKNEILFINTAVQTEKINFQNQKRNLSVLHKKNLQQRGTIQNNKRQESKVNELRTERRTPTKNNISPGTKINTMRYSVEQNFDLIFKFKNFNNQCENRKSQQSKQIYKKEQKKCIPQDILFQEIKFDKNATKSEFKRGIGRKIINSKTNQNSIKNSQIFNRKNEKQNYMSLRNSQNSNIGKKSQFYFVNQSHSKNAQKQQKQFNIQKQLKKLQSKKIQSQIVIQSSKVMDFSKQKKEDYSQKYQQRLINLLIHAKQEISLEKVSQAIEKYKLSCFETRSASTYEKQNI